MKPNHTPRPEAARPTELDRVGAAGRRAGAQRAKAAKGNTGRRAGRDQGRGR